MSRKAVFFIIVNIWVAAYILAQPEPERRYFLLAGVTLYGFLQICTNRETKA